MCLPVLLLCMQGWAAAANPSQLSAAAGKSCSEPASMLADEQPELVAEQSVSILHVLHQRVRHPHSSLLKKQRIRFNLHRLGDDEDGAVAQHQHRRFGLEANSLRGDVLPLTVARLSGLQEQYSSAAIFASSGRDPPVL
ncbi:MAG TPA: hypothetical protein DGA22_05680 [Acidobacterium sp.]|uniref:Lipoprotein n=1 Tax=Acidobacterium capsulatum (strain ATCC 51196 / DSM 11244 / BCRC 80197 / JCM 7670 / NBRC 15755 / NCIMB 13165 / 161) TaxID=240015 RepID=C1F4A3_ACIC5|nr:hypothetical protein ACP_1132 [Acidobacterium capsulatum ATCC 51196]HCT60357.1 hypothetical protein [Acidobacterium sp.]